MPSGFSEVFSAAFAAVFFAAGFSAAFAAVFVLLLYFLFDDTTQLYGLGILAVAFLFTLRDIKRHAEE